MNHSFKEGGKAPFYPTERPAPTNKDFTSGLCEAVGGRPNAGIADTPADTNGAEPDSHKDSFFRNLLGLPD